MNNIDAQQFGSFIATLRKEKGWTQMQLVSGSIEISMEEQKNRRIQREKRFLWYVLEIVVAAVELLLIYKLGITLEDIAVDLLVVVLLPILFGLWFFFFIREKLPAYYDKEKISFYADGVLRMNVPGLCFNNRNWPYIVKAGRVFCASVPVLYPFFYFLLRLIISDEMWNVCRLPVTLTVVLGGLFLPMYILGKKYE